MQHFAANGCGEDVGPAALEHGYGFGAGLGEVLSDVVAAVAGADDDDVLAAEVAV